MKLSTISRTKKDLIVYMGTDLFSIYIFFSGLGGGCVCGGGVCVWGGGGEVVAVQDLGVWRRGGE